jgi:glyoxylase-like metal-dependent hydrolase (beta-lactamase superfamily II)
VGGGRFRLDGGAMFGFVPKALWSTPCPPDDDNRIRQACNCLLIRRDDVTILVDTGLGDRASAAERQRYAIEPGAGLALGLKEAGVPPEEVTHVVFTHLHFDHAAGALADREGELFPVCPNARHLVQRGEWEDALAGRSIMKTSYRPDDLRAVEATVDVAFLDGDAEIEPGIEVLVTGGHTPHHQAILVRGDERSLLYPGDLIPLRPHLSPYWVMAYDMEPFRTLERKRDLATQAASDGWIVAWDHDPDTPWSLLRRQDGRLVAAEVTA